MRSCFTLVVRGLERRLQGKLEPLAGQRGTGDDIHLGTLGLNRFLLQIRHGDGVDLLRCATIARILQEPDILDLPTLDVDLHLDEPIVACGPLACGPVVAVG